MSDSGAGMMNFPTKFGFEPDLRKCEGKTIDRVEFVAMEFGCTWNAALAVRFTDGTRAFFGATVGIGIMNPRIDGSVYGEAKTVETSDIFTKREYAEMVTAKNANAVQRHQEHERSERRRYEELAAKYGAKDGE